jgi:hypothetical protein
MSINRLTFLGFVSEMSKTAVLRQLGRWTAQGATAGGPVGMVMGAGLPLALQGPAAFSAQDPTGQERSRFERVTDLGANVVGGMTGAGAAMAATKRLRINPVGQGGILANMGAALKAGPGAVIGRTAKFIPRNLLMMGIPTAAGMGLAHLATAPSRAARLKRVIQRQREMGTQDNEAGGAVSPGLHGASAASPIAQEGQQGQMR